MKVFKLLNLALQFTTRLPGWHIKEYSEQELGKSGVFFPIIGLIVGLILYLEFILLSQVNYISIALLLIVSEILISGGLHLDGYMDTMDGLLSGTKGDKMLRIMADSNVGAHSVSMLFVLMFAKFAFLLELLSIAPMVIILVPFLGRVVMLLSIITFPYPKETGIGIIYKENLNKKYVYLMTVISIFLAAAIIPYSIIAISLTAATVYSIALNVKAKIGGLTGDVYGAIKEITEAVFLCYLFIIYLFIGR